MIFRRSPNAISACLLAPILIALGGSSAAADAGQWDSTISNTSWYVTVPQMLAYASSSTSFADPVPIGDQTLWALGTSVNGVFTGTSSATLAIGPVTTVSDSSIQGYVTPDGRITMVFTPTGGGSTTIGLGQMQEKDGVTLMEMQMITGTSLLVSHWAYMAPYDPGSFTPPSAQVVPSNASPQWSWTAGTPWRVVSPGLFGSGAPGSFIITDYKSGYFWGQGVGPGGASSGFTLLGSITPEGKVLFNVLSDAQLTSLYGDITGDASTAQMLLGTYNSLGLVTGDLSYLYVIRPYAETVAAAGNWSALGAAEVLYAIAGTVNGLTGAMAPAVGALNNLSGAALSGAISQTLPVLAGDGVQATANTQRAIQQVVINRLEDLAGDQKADGPEAQRHAWMTPLGGVSSQTSLNGAPGYQATGGGVALGMDTDLSPDLLVGGMFAYSTTTLDASAAAAPGTLDIDSYFLGTYGAYTLAPGLGLDARLAVGLNQNSASRAILFMNGTATASYDGGSIDAGLGLKRAFHLGNGLVLTPSLRLDYLQVSAESYSETGAGALNLSVDAQDYRELFLTTALRADCEVADGIKLTARGGAGYNVLDNRTQIVSSFEGGGASFVAIGPDVSPWLFTAGAGIVGARGDTFGLGAHYDLQASPSGFLSQTASLSFKMKI